MGKKYTIRIAVLLAAACAAATLAEAAGDTGAGAAAPDQTLAEIVVTGTAIPTTPDEVSVPVDTLGTAQIETSGVGSNALEILRKTIPAFEGRSNAGTSNANNNNQNTAGGSQVQLRNLPTLVLINGRRVANSGIGGINGKNFVDVNQIPAAAIDHVDVLTDGASSLYGSDAVGGVVNFVLKSDYEGFSAGARRGTGDRYGEHSYFALGGFKLGQASFTAVVNLSHTDPLFPERARLHESAVRQDFGDSRRGRRRQRAAEPVPRLAERQESDRHERGRRVARRIGGERHLPADDAGRHQRRIRRLAVSDLAAQAGHGIVRQYLRHAADRRQQTLGVRQFDGIPRQELDAVASRRGDGAHRAGRRAVQSLVDAVHRRHVRLLAEWA